MKIYCPIIVLLLFIISCKTEKSNDNALEEQVLIKSSKIHLRDPFILADDKTKTYYLYTSIHNRTQSEGQGVEVYTSTDLQNWTSPKPVFHVSENFWAKKYVWAPEVHYYNGKYYLFVTFTSDDILDNPPEAAMENASKFNKRGTQILVSESPMGLFIPFNNQPHTTIDWMTIDGTFWEEGGQPYMIYCHEWTQIKDGTVDLIELENDLSAVRGENQVLFNGSEAPWVQPIAEGTEYITDGCYLYKTKTAKVLMIWSSADTEGFSIGVAESESGSVKGPWKHQANPLVEKNGLHAMIFETFDGRLILALHQPNSSPDERMKLHKLIDTGETLELMEKLF